MTSITHRIAALFRIKASKALDRAEDPREVLDCSNEQQLRMLRKVRRGVADVATSRRRVDLQVNPLRQSTGKLRDQARQAIAAGRRDLAREALPRRTAVASQITDLQEQQTSLRAQEEKLTLAAQRLQTKVVRDLTALMHRRAARAGRRRHDHADSRRGPVRDRRRAHGPAQRAGLRAAVGRDAGQEAAFTTALSALLDAVRGLGTPLPDEEITPSGLVLPDEDTSLTQVRQVLSDEGLIPG